MHNLSRLAFRLRSLAVALGFERAVVLGMFVRLWSILAGPVTMWLVARSFSKDVQGYYYTFASILASQVMFELGFGRVIMQFVSHDWSKLRLDDDGRLAGETEALERLLNLGRFAIRWFLGAGIAFWICASAAGLAFFANIRGQTDVAWLWPWLAICFTSSLVFCISPFWALLEGCNQMVIVNRYRLRVAVLFSLACWAAMLGGAGLWAGFFGNLALLLGTAYLLWVKQRLFFRPFFLPASIGWKPRAEIWGVQWRTGVGWVHGYFFFSIFSPVMFAYHGPVAAGQMGMTLVLANTLRMLAETVILTKAPAFGMLVARKQFRELERLVRVAATSAVGISILGSAVIEALLWSLRAWNHPLAERLLPPVPTGYLLAAGVLLQICAALSSYLRAFAREPFALMSAVNTVVVVGGLTWLGRQYGAYGMTLGYLADIALVVLPWHFVLWHTCRYRWQSEGEV